MIILTFIVGLLSALCLGKILYRGAKVTKHGTAYTRPIRFCRYCGNLLCPTPRVGDIKR